MAELHIFDFDGTLFRSPMPHPDNGPEIIEEVQAPWFEDGLGWFHSPRTLNPPIVPQIPDSSWFITPMVEHAKQMIAEGHFVVVLTGREEPFRERVSQLLSLCMLKPHKLLLKPSQESGTVRYKTEQFIAMIEEWRPSKIVIYDDRFEQAVRLEAALAEIQFMVTQRRGRVPYGADLLTEDVPRFLRHVGVSVPPGYFFEFSVKIVPEKEGEVSYLSASEENRLFHLLDRDRAKFVAEYFGSKKLLVKWPESLVLNDDEHIDDN